MASPALQKDSRLEFTLGLHGAPSEDHRLCGLQHPWTCSVPIGTAHEMGFDDFPTATIAMDDDIGGTELLRCRLTGSPDGPQLLVLKGDLTASTADAIVNAANSLLMHGGGLAGAIARKGGESIQLECSAWIRSHGPLDEGSAMSTSSGELPCKYVIHTVGPKVAPLPEPTPMHTQQLRSAVWSALAEAERLGLRSVVIPGISTGIFGYPRDLGAREVVNECARFCREHPSTVRVIGLMNIDDPTVSSFVEAVENAALAGHWEIVRSPSPQQQAGTSQPASNKPTSGIWSQWWRRARSYRVNFLGCASCSGNEPIDDS